MRRDPFRSDDNKAYQGQETGQFRCHREKGGVGVRGALVNVGRIEVERNGGDLEAEPGKHENNGQPSGSDQRAGAAQ